MTPNQSEPGAFWRMRLEDLNVPVPYASHVQRFQILCKRLYGQTMEQDEAADFLYRILVVTRYRQLTRVPHRPVVPTPVTISQVRPHQSLSYAPLISPETPTSTNPDRD